MILGELHLHIFPQSTVSYGAHILFISRHPPCNFSRKIVSWLILGSIFILLAKRDFFLTCMCFLLWTVPLVPGSESLKALVLKI